ncbi:TadE/TadG family type IV pilus assembly protein [Pararhizobium sp. IMCC21322]|uniref:TadE/TadG family type IV pilus assembly protein n=1 Tax=Pararhizobium sp. IMCC21322 TaxID=3067903 RepID=UPI002740F0C9|nr:TadE/TadG family type IV pilus assembly protein [Pararhizobium sp. IMCC21322]
MRKFFSQQSGTALTEGVIIFPIMVLAVAACVEFGFLLHQWNTGAKAMQLGVRKLIVSDPVTPDFYSVFSFDDSQTGGLIAPNAGAVSTCGANTGVTCNAALMQRIVSGSGSWQGLQAFFPALQVDDITVTYQLNGLGYQGRPDGPVVSVRMELARNAINLPITSAILDLIDISFPSFAVTATSEDLQSCPDGCS